MPRNVRCALIQASNALSTEKPLAQIRKAMIDKHLKLIEQAAKKKAQILCLQELFYGPYFCAEQNARWYELTEKVPDGPTTQLMQKIAKKHGMAIVVPVYEEQMPGVYFNTAAVIDADGKYLGKYRKHHIPHCHPGFWEKFYFTPGDLGYPVFQTKFAKVGVYICYDRHFPEGARVLGIKRRGYRIQPVGNGRGAVGISLGTRAAGPRRSQRILRRRHQSRRHRKALEHWRVLWQELFLQSARQDRRPGQPR